jgi:predicted RNase H-like HicB family nuclease
MKEIPHTNRVTLHIEFDREADGRFIADIPELPGVMAYGASPEEARTKVVSLALHVIAEEALHNKPISAVTFA